MTLINALTAAGMTPPQNITLGRWTRFPGCGKGRANRSGWCRMITPTLAIYGDWSTGLSEVWRDNAHQDDATTRQMLAQARAREQDMRRKDRERQRLAALKAADIIKAATRGTHPYLERKGFPDSEGLIYGEHLVIPMRDANDYPRVLSAQLIDAEGEKRFLPGGRTRAAIYRIGSEGSGRIVLCEGYATALSIASAIRRLPGAFQILVCFSAQNLERVGQIVPRNAVVAADNDRSGTGERAACATGLRWTMPYEVATDFNDLHQAMGLHVVTERMRELFAQSMPA